MFSRMDPDPFLRSTFWTVGIGTIFQWIPQLGMHPGAVQRFVALPTYKKARNSLIYFLIGIAVVKILTGAIGMLIYTKYKDCDPVMANVSVFIIYTLTLYGFCLCHTSNRLFQLISSDRNLLPYFVMDVAGKLPGVTGLFISGIISAALRYVFYGYI